MARKIMIASGKGGVGKTTITALLGIFLAKLGNRVLLVDFDFYLNNLDNMLGVEDKIVYDIFDCVNETCEMAQAIIKDVQTQNLFLLASKGLKNHTILNFEKIDEIVKKLSRNFDYVLIDCPAGIGKRICLANKLCDEILIVVTPTFSSCRDANKLICLFDDEELKKINIIVNQTRRNLVSKKLMLSCREIENLLNKKVVGDIPICEKLLTCGIVPTYKILPKEFLFLCETMAKKIN